MYILDNFKLSTATGSRKTIYAWVSPHNDHAYVRMDTKWFIARRIGRKDDGSSKFSVTFAEKQHSIISDRIFKQLELLRFGICD